MFISGGTPSRGKNIARASRALEVGYSPPLFSYLQWAMFFTVFGVGSAVGGEWRPQEETSFCCLSTFQVRALCPDKEVCVGYFGGAKKERCVGCFGEGQEGTVRWLFW